MLRLIEDESFRGNDAYTVMEMLIDIRNGVWSELVTGSHIDVYRRNLQRSYIEQMREMMQSSASTVHGSDIQALIRDELNSLEQLIEQAIDRSGDHMTRVHLRDVRARIHEILDI